MQYLILHLLTEMNTKKLHEPECKIEMDSVRWFSVNKVDEELNTAQFQHKTREILWNRHDSPMISQQLFVFAILVWQQLHTQRSSNRTFRL